jgi:hypothetical protein
MTINGYTDIQNPLVKKLDRIEKFENFFEIKDVGFNYWSVGRGKTRGKSVGSRILYKGEIVNSKDQPYLKGSNIFKYHNSAPDNHLRHNYNEYLNENDVFRFSKELFEKNPKIIYRQTSSKIIATIDKKSILTIKQYIY